MPGRIHEMSKGIDTTYGGGISRDVTVPVEHHQEEFIDAHMIGTFSKP